MSLGKLAVSLWLRFGRQSRNRRCLRCGLKPTNGGSILIIRNVAAQPLTGFLIELLNYPGSYHGVWQDNITAEPIAPAQSRRRK